MYVLLSLSTSTNLYSFSITFLNEVQDGELLFIDDKGKQSGRIEPLCSGCKNLVLNNLSGVVGAIDQLRYVDKIVILEGKSERLFLRRCYQNIVSFWEGRSQMHISIK